MPPVPLALLIPVANEGNNIRLLTPCFLSCVSHCQKKKGIVTNDNKGDLVVTF